MDLSCARGPSNLICGVFFATMQFVSGFAHAQDAGAPIRPADTLRVAVQAYNPALVVRTRDGEFNGVAVDLANALGKKRGQMIKFVPYDDPVHYNQSINKDEWDVAIAPRDLSRGSQLGFSEPLLEIDSSYVTRAGSPLTRAEDVDRAGVRVGVAQGSPNDGYLTRTLRSAQIVRLFGGALEAKQSLASGRIDVYADNTNVAYRIAAEVPGANVLVTRFNSTRITFAVPKKNSKLLEETNEFVQQAKRDGLVSDAVRRAGLRGVRQAR
jgi:polar amino acid transport system substrate-binding protein